jgi:hypothetical protein
MVNPGQDGDFTNDPTQNPDHELARKVDSRYAEVEELRNIRSEGGFKAVHDRQSIRSYQIRHSNQSLHKDDDKFGMEGDVKRYRQESSATAYEHHGDCTGPHRCSTYPGDVEAQKDIHIRRGNMF